MSNTSLAQHTHATSLGARDRLMLAMLMWMATDPALRAAQAAKKHRENAPAPLVVIFIVAIAVLLAIAVALTVAAIVFCNRKGMNFEWLIKTSWFTAKVACSS